MEGYNITSYIVVLDISLLDTREYNDSIGSIVAYLRLQILSWIAKEERENEDHGSLS